MSGDGVIAVRVPNWLGDTVMALPALSALRAARPDSRVVAVGRWAPLLSGQEVADVLLPYPSMFKDRIAFARAFGQDRPDLAVLLVNSIESALAAWRWGARRRLGFDTDGRRPWLTDPISLPSPRCHQIDEYGLLLSATGIAVDAEAVPIWRRRSTPSIDKELDALLSDAGIPAGARVIGLHLGAAFGPSKQWAPESFGRLAALLELETLCPVLLGPAESEDVARAVAEAAASPLPSLVGRDRPSLLPGLLARLACLVSGDTGVAHLAAALGVSTVTLFGPTDSRLTAPRAKTARVVVHQVPCSPCFLAECPIDHVCMSKISPDEVLTAVRSAIGA